MTVVGNFPPAPRGGSLVCGVRLEVSRKNIELVSNSWSRVVGAGDVWLVKLERS